MDAANADRPFRWVEIHEQTKEKLTQLEKDLRKEVTDQLTPFPVGRGEQARLLLMLGDKADEWVERACEVYNQCLAEIGREKSPQVMDVVWNFGLSYFIGEQIRDLLFTACGIDDATKTAAAHSHQFPFLIQAMPDALKGVQRVNEIVENLQRAWKEKMQTPSQNRVPDQGAPPSDTAAASSNSADSLGVGIHVSPDGKFSASPDYCTVRFNEAEYTLTPSQSRMMQVLWEAWESGYPAVAKDRLAVAGRDDEEKRVRDTWRGSGLWGTLIVRPRTGRYQLNLRRK
jgi:hypothetical protein